MRNTDSALAPISDAEFTEGLRNLEGAIARGERPRPTGTDLVVLTSRAGFSPTCAPGRHWGDPPSARVEVSLVAWIR